MRLVLTSDTHGRNPPDLVLPEGDVLIHCGDATMGGDIDEIRAFARWMRRQPHEIKLFVPGNHDFALRWDDQRYPTALALLTGAGVTTLIDSALSFGGVNFWGHPWTPVFGRWAFMAKRDAMREKCAAIPETVDVLISHGPPHLVLDTTASGDHAGCEFLLRAVTRIRPRLHVFGHIHEAHGADRHVSGTEFRNVAALDRAYRPREWATAHDLFPWAAA